MDSNYENKRKQRTVKKKLKRGLETERERRKNLMYVEDSDRLQKDKDTYKRGEMGMKESNGKLAEREKEIDRHR